MRTAYLKTLVWLSQLPLEKKPYQDRYLLFFMTVRVLNLKDSLNARHTSRLVF